MAESLGVIERIIFCLSVCLFVCNAKLQTVDRQHRQQRNMQIERPSNIFIINND